MNQQANITVGKLSIECHLPTGDGNSVGVAQRLKKISRNGLTRALEECLQPIDSANETVVLIKQLQLELDIDLQLSEGEIARLWADKLKRVLLKTMSGNGSQTVVSFASPAHYLARALVDILRGRAHQLWYYRRFDGLWALPLSAALRTAILDDPPAGLDALTTLDDRELIDLCAALDSADAERLLTGLSGSESDTQPGIDAAKFFVKRLGDLDNFNNGLGDRPQHHALFLTIKAMQQNPGKQIAEQSACARLVALLQQIKLYKSQLFPLIVEKICARQISSLGQWLPDTMIANLAPMLSCEAEVLRVLAEPLTNEVEIVFRDRDGMSLANNFTWFGNALLLLPQIDRLPLAQVDQRWPELHQHAPARMLRWLVLCLCQGSDRFTAAAGDPLLRDLCGVGPNIRLAEATSWLQDCCAGRELTRLFTSLKQQALTNGQNLHCFKWRKRQDQIRIHAQTQKGCWLDLTLAAEAAALDAIPPCDDKELKRLVKQDFRCLNPGPGTGLDTDARACLLVLAQFTLKSFAYRLPGFANCSLDYLLRNFLSMSATLVVEETQIIAYLSRVPMGIMLNMTGINRDRIELAGFDPRPIHLTESD
ncbi:MAG: hypothetical protein GY916_06905 [Gammaproteobacteria bacterium]|nr:hypothetical protein [Gammaproteobacteria bacterium]